MLHREVDLLDAEPFEHAAVSSDSRNESGYILPILMRDIFLEIGYAMLIGVFRDSPGQYLEVLFTPVLLYPAVLEHLVDANRDNPHDRVLTYVPRDHLLPFV